MVAISQFEDLERWRKSKWHIAGASTHEGRALWGAVRAGYLGAKWNGKGVKPGPGPKRPFGTGAQLITFSKVGGSGD